MAGAHRLRLYTPTGDYVRTLDAWRSIDGSLVENDVGVVTIVLSSEYTDDAFPRDARIAWERSPQLNGYYYPPKLVGDVTWLVVERERSVVENGDSTITLICEHPNRILNSRVVAYDEGSAQADKADTASNAMYDYVNENFVAATDTTRNLSSTHFILDPAPNPGVGGVMTANASYQSVLEVLQDMVRSSSQQGSYIGFEVYTPVAPGPYHCRFYSVQRGVNRSLNSGQAFILYSTQVRSGGLSSSRVLEDWSDIATFAYTGGAGANNERIVQTASDPVLMSASPFGRIEAFQSSGTIDGNVLTTDAYDVLRQYRPQRAFTSDYSNQNEAVFDLHFGWGDIIGAQFLAPVLQFGQITSWVEYLFNVRVDPVHLTVQRFFNNLGDVIDEQESVQIHLRNLVST